MKTLKSLLYVFLAAYGERHLGRSRGVEFLGTYILLRREIDAVTIGIFGFPGVEVLVVVTPHEEERRQDTTDNSYFLPFYLTSPR